MEDEIEGIINGTIRGITDSYFNYQIVTEIINWINQINKL